MSENLNSIEKARYHFDVTSKRLGIGFDIGFVYEWRPNGGNYEEEMDCKVGEMKYVNKYKLRVGLSVTDIGWLTYKKSANSNNLILNGATNVAKDFKHFDISNGVMNGVNQHLNELIATNPTYQRGEESEYFRTSLPTAISLQVDYHIWKGFYLNFTPFISLHQAINVKDDFAKIHSYSIVSLTPRFEHKWFGFSIPLQYNQMSKTGVAVGVGLRLGPLWVGTNDLIGLCSKNTFGANVQAALKVPIMYNKKRDRDGDLISDRKDKCKDVPGLCEYQGCPPPVKEEEIVPDEVSEIEVELEPEPEEIPEPVAEIFDEPVIVEPDEPEQVEFTHHILFETGKTTIDTSYYALLNDLVSILNSNPECYVTMDGHSDNVGREELNMTLSQGRADAVKKYLLDEGIAPERVVAKGYGYTQPIADNNTVEGRAKNRRVEINVVTP
jgi:outer membrane protein OmpA-like peptidoglycan-associated protein